MENILEIEQVFHANAHTNFCDKMCELFKLKSFNYDLIMDHGNNKGFVEINGFKFEDASIDPYNNLSGVFDKLPPVELVPIFAKVVSELFSPKVTKSFANRSYIHMFVIYIRLGLSNLELSDIKHLLENDIKPNKYDDDFRYWLIKNENFKYYIRQFTKEQLESL